MIKGLENIGIVVGDLAATVAFFVELGLELEGQAPVEGAWVDRISGLDGVRLDVAMMRTPDGQSRLELMQFHSPTAVDTKSNATVNALGIRRLLFSVNDIDAVAARLQAYGSELLGEVVQYEDSYRLCYLRGPEGIIVALSEQLN